MSIGQNNRRIFFGFLAQLGLTGQISRKEVLEDASIGRVGHNVIDVMEMISCAISKANDQLVYGEAIRKQWTRGRAERQKNNSHERHERKDESNSSGYRTLGTSCEAFPSKYKQPGDGAVVEPRAHLDDHAMVGEM